MTQSIDFNTANDLAKFLSDKLGNNPGPAKILHWISEHQGHRNAKAFKASLETMPAKPMSTDDLAPPREGDFHIVGGDNASEDTDIPSHSYRLTNAKTRFRNQVYLIAHDFLMGRRGDLLHAFQAKQKHPELDLEELLYNQAWEEVESYTGGLLTESHLMILDSALSFTARDQLNKQVRNMGLADTAQNVFQHAYEEATKDVIVSFLRELNEDMASLPFHPSDLAEPESSVIWTYLEKATDSAWAWVE